ncbi:MAG: Slp family lipoprotein [Pseudomonadota bacterium]
MKTSSLALAALALLLTAGCASSIVPPALQHEVVPGLELAAVKQNQAAHQNQVVLWGGRIIKTINKKRGTLIEVLQLPLDYEERPKQVNQSQGRFIVSMTGFLDPEIYKTGKDLTVVGRIAGVETLPLGEIIYTYVLLRGEEVYLWPPRPHVIKYEGFGPVFYYGVGPGYWYNAPYMWW